MSHVRLITASTLPILILVAVVGCSSRSPGDQLAIDTITRLGGTFEASPDGTIQVRASGRLKPVSTRLLSGPI